MPQFRKEDLPLLLVLLLLPLLLDLLLLLPLLLGDRRQQAADPQLRRVDLTGRWEKETRARLTMPRVG